MKRRVLQLLESAESALRETLHGHDLDPTAREHMERALSHTREAYIATNEIGKARSVQHLVRDLESVERLLVTVSKPQQLPVTTTSIHV